jgi:hypothetical protein
MGLADVQRVLARLSIERALVDRFCADPSAVGAELGLVADEALGLLQIPRRQLEQFADSLRRKRRDQVRRAVPIAARALGREFETLFERYVDESPPRGSKADIDDAAGFVAALGRWAEQLEPPWAADVARYELACRQAAHAGRVPIVRKFRFPVAELVTRQEAEPVAPRATLACWLRPSRRGSVWHIVISVPSLGSPRRFFTQPPMDTLHDRTNHPQIEQGNWRQPRRYR